jgi:Zn-dependent protease
VVQDIPSLVSTAITLLIAFTVHEFAHAWTADQLGDDTPRRNGRLSLNPLRHLDPLGTLMLLFAGFGWAKPVPINPSALERRTPAGTMLVSVAGPFSNLVLALLGSVPFKAGLLTAGLSGNSLIPTVADVLQVFVFINLILLLFNLLPISPLDGEKVLTYFLPSSGQATMQRLRPYGPLILILLIVLGRFGGFNILNALIGAPASRIFTTLVT